jgi:hypothetical protein
MTREVTRARLTHRSQDIKLAAIVMVTRLIQSSPGKRKGGSGLTPLEKCSRRLGFGGPCGWLVTCPGQEAVPSGRPPCMQVNTMFRRSSARS